MQSRAHDDGVRTTKRDVEEEIALGRTDLDARRGATAAELRQSRWDIAIGMLFSNTMMYFIILSTASTLHAAGHRDVSSAADAARSAETACRECGGHLVRDWRHRGRICRGAGDDDRRRALGLPDTGVWPYGLHKRPSEARAFYALIAGFTVVAMGMNFLGVNPIKALVWAGIVQGFSTSPLVAMMMTFTSDRKVMGSSVNSKILNALGWSATAAVSAAAIGLITSWII